jgi:two-component system, chemotaxis family, sensor kinase CheA
LTKDRYRYYRVEADELLAGLTQGVLELEHHGAPADVVRRLLRLAHTLKGASRVVKLPEIADHAHAIEDVLALYRDSTTRAGPDKPTIDKLLAALDGIRARLAPLALSPVTVPAGTRGEMLPAAAEESFRSVRVELAELDEVLQTTARIGGVVERLGAAAQLDAFAPFAGHRDELGRELDDLRERVFRLRLLPAETVFSDLRRAARDAGGSLGTSVEIEFSGGEIRLDAHVLAALRGALLHIVRNCVAHGIEDAAARAALGKPEAGRISFGVTRIGHRAVFTCGDDGRGIDEPAVKQAAAQRGLVSADVALSLGQGELIELLLKGGVSTSRSVTNLAGRGVGLDVVSDTVKRLKGECRIVSTFGVGTTVELTVPISLSSMRALAVQAGGAAVLIPLDAVRETARIDTRRLCATATGEAYLWNERPLPFIALAKLLRAETPFERDHPRAVVVLRGANGELALGVDQLLDVRDIILQPLPLLATASALVAGVALDAAGVPRIVMAPGELDTTALTARAAPIEEASDAALPILVIDDSLTTRMLEQTILEAAGYEVDLASSAEDGLAKAARRSYALFIVDVEMPGMSGFEFVALTRADPRFAAIPCILVTSRNALEDRRQGHDAGASAYFVKSEFDQGALLAGISRLLI